MADKTVGLELDAVTTTKRHADTPVVELGDVKRVFVHGCSSGPGVGAFVRVPERCASELVLEANSFGALKEPVARVAAER